MISMVQGKNALSGNARGPGAPISPGSPGAGKTDEGGEVGDRRGAERLRKAQKGFGANELLTHHRGTFVHPGIGNNISGGEVIRREHKKLKDERKDGKEPGVPDNGALGNGEGFLPTTEGKGGNPVPKLRVGTGKDVIQSDRVANRDAQIDRGANNQNRTPANPIKGHPQLQAAASGNTNSLSEIKVKARGRGKERETPFEGGEMRDDIGGTKS